MATENLSPLTLPALRAYMGDWIYYIAFLKMQDVAERISVAEEIHQSETLKRFIQRELDESKHSAKIRDYLLTQPQRFFNALVVGVYEGSPSWYELGIKGNQFFDEENLPSYIEGALGILVLNGSEKLFAIDGQHRVVGIKQAIVKNDSLGKEEVCAIFVAHSNDSQGLERTRRLFTTLNRYAKPVSRYEIIALDEDDVVAIITRRLIEEHPLFNEKISLAKQKNIPVKDSHSFTTIVTVYDVLDIYLCNVKRGWKDFKRKRPEETLIDSFYNKASELWDTLALHFKPIEVLRDSAPSDGVAAKYRNKEGGHLLFRPVGLLVFIKVLRRFLDSGVPLLDAVQQIAKVPMNINEKPWAGLLWDSTNQRMLTAPENQNAVVKMLFYMAGGDLASFKINYELLRKELAGLLNKEVSEVEILQYI